jgi:NADH-quinone oxidoreductase subunit A
MDNTQLSGFGTILIFVIGAVAFVIITLTIAKLIRPNRPNFEKLTSYECGEDTVGNAWGRFNPRFYIIALIFILFEIEIVFLIPWATVFGNSHLIRDTNGLWGWFSLFEAFIFIGILSLGLAYAWSKGFLEWVKPKPEIEKFESKIPVELYKKINIKYSAVKAGNKLK